MTPVSTAKLGIRILVVTCLVMGVLPQVVLFLNILFEIMAGRASSAFDLQGIAPPCIVLVLITVLAAIVWWRAEWLGRFLLPAATSREVSSDYATWEDAGLMFVGAVALWRGVMAANTAIAFIFGFVSPSMAIPFLVFGVILIIGPSTLAGLILRRPIQR